MSAAVIKLTEEPPISNPDKTAFLYWVGGCLLVVILAGLYMWSTAPPENTLPEVYGVM